MPGKRQSNSFTLQAKARDGAAAVTYSIDSTVDGVTVASDTDIAYLDTTVRFWKKKGDSAEAAYPCYWALYRRAGTSYRRVSYTSARESSKSFSGVPTTVSGLLYDAFVVFISDSVMGGINLANASPADFLAKKEIAVNKQGDSGATGPNYFPVGKYSDQVEYVRSATMIPVVFAEGTVWNEYAQAYGTYHFLARDTNVVGGVHYAPGDAGGYWEECANFGIVIAGGVWANFGKIGAGIMSGDFMYSAYGTIDGMELADGQGADGGPAGGSNPPAYTRFAGDPAELCGSFSRTVTGATSGDRSAVLRLHLAAGMTLNVTIKGTKTGSGNFYFRLYRGTTLVGSMATFYGTSQESYSRTVTIDGEYTVECFGSSAATACTFTLTYATGGIFVPHLWMNLKKGKMSAARGNFTVDADGAITIGGDVSIHGALSYGRILTDKAGNSIQTFWHRYGGQEVGIDAQYVDEVKLLYDTYIVSGAYRDAGYALFSGIVCTGYTVLLPPARLFVGMHIRIVNGTVTGSPADLTPSPVNLAVVYRTDTDEYRDYVDTSYTANLISAAVPVVFQRNNTAFTLTGAPESVKCTDLTPATAAYFTVFALMGSPNGTYRSMELVAQPNPYVSGEHYAWMIIDAQQ